MHEAAFYHALSDLHEGDYRKMRKVRTRYGGWENAARACGVDAERAWATLQRSGIALALMEDASYPRLLREIPHPPFGIYFKGDISAAERDTVIAIVGTRKATAAGMALATEFGAALARAGAIVVSGLAFGIDAAAHAGALEAHGPTIAVLASGLDRVYPSSHERMAEHIIEGGGVLISEYPPGSAPYQARFLERNRIVSGLAHAVLAIEAPERSGVIATARFAMEQNRDLYAVPGVVSHPNYKGSRHHLIRQGATLVTSPAELLQDLGFAPEEAITHIPALTPYEIAVLETIRGAGRALTIDEIIEAATLTSSVVNGSLTTLILKNGVREEEGRYDIY